MRRLSALFAAAATLAACSHDDPAPPSPPPAPASVVAASPMPGLLRVTWAAVPDATSYAVYRAEGTIDPATATRVDVTAPTATFGGLVPGSTWNVAVASIGAAGAGARTPDVVADVRPLAELTSSSATASSASLAWTPVSDGSYVLYRSTVSPVDPATATAIPAPTAAWEDLDLAPDATYFYAVAAVFEGAESALGPELQVRTLLAAPALQATAGEGEVTLAWTDPNVSTTSYDLYWSDAGPVTPASSRIAGVSSPYVHAVPALGRTYRYAIVAVGAAGESPLSAEATATCARTGQLPTLVASGITTFGQSIAGGFPEHFPGQSGFWELQPDLSIASGFDGPFASPGAQVLLVGRLSTSPPTFESLVGEQDDLDFFPYDQGYGDLKFFTPLFTVVEDGLEIAALSSASTVGGLPVAPISGARSAFLNATSGSRLQQPLDLTAASSATVAWSQVVYLSEGLFPGAGSSFDALLRAPDGALVETLSPTCAAAPAGFETCSADVGAAALGRAVVLSFELRAAAPGIAELDDVVVTGGAGLLNGGFEADDGWVTNPGAEPQNVTGASRTLCVDGPMASPCPTPLAVTRSFFTAPTSAWARVVDVFENPGAADVQADVVYVTYAAGGDTTVLYDPGGAGSAVAAYDAGATPVRDFGLVLGDATPFYVSASRDGLLPGEPYVFAVRPIVVPAGGRIAIASFLVMDGARSHVGGGTAATGVEQVATAIADGFASPTDSTYRDWLTQEQLDAIVNF